MKIDTSITNKIAWNHAYDIQMQIVGDNSTRTWRSVSDNWEAIPDDLRSIIFTDILRTISEKNVNKSAQNL